MLELKLLKLHPEFELRIRSSAESKADPLLTSMSSKLISRTSSNRPSETSMSFSLLMHEEQDHRKYLPMPWWAGFGLTSAGVLP